MLLGHVLCLWQTIHAVSEVSQALEEIAVKLDQCRTRSNVGRLSGSSVAIVGTVLSVTGGILSFFTFGASLPLLIVGASLAASGGITATGSLVAEKVVSKKALRRADQLWERFKEDRIIQSYFGLGEISNDGQTSSMVSPLKGSESGLTSTEGSNIALATARTFRIADVIADASTPASATLRVLTTAGRALVITGLVVDGLLLPLSVYDLVTASLDLHRKTGHPAGQVMRSLLNPLKVIDHDLRRQARVSMDKDNAERTPGGLKNANFHGSFSLL